MRTPWQTLETKTIFDSKFLKVYQDEVRLPNGNIINDYTLVEKPSVVVIVAIDSHNNLIVLNEYKHGAKEYLNVLPAGHLAKGENSLEAARRELLEETGYSGENFSELGVLYDYPSKDVHKVNVVLVKDIKKVTEENHEETESITYKLVPLGKVKQQILNKEWKSTSSISALCISGVLF
ncbi:MAG: NUDIX hydrolase [Patescibacteria group bacterium]